MNVKETYKLDSWHSPHSGLTLSSPARLSKWLLMPLPQSRRSVVQSDQVLLCIEPGCHPKDQPYQPLSFATHPPALGLTHLGLRTQFRCGVDKGDTEAFQQGWPLSLILLADLPGLTATT